MKTISLKNISPLWPLRLGLGFVYCFTGYNILTSPLTWAGFLPVWFSQAVSNVVPLTLYLRVQGGAELLMGLLLLIWFTPRLLLRMVLLVMMVELVFILIFVGVDSVTFRDGGLLGAAVALYLLLGRNPHKRAQ